MHFKDYTNRKGNGLGLLGLALSFAYPAYLTRSTWLSALAAFLALAGITVIGIDSWSKRKVAIVVEAFVDYLSHLLTISGNTFTPAFDSRKFAIVKVTNTGSKNLKKVVAKCQFNHGVEEPGIWSLNSGDSPDGFAIGGSHKANLDVGDSRLLVVAQGLSADKLWARLSRQQPFRWPARGTDLENGVGYFDDSAQVLSVASDAAMTVRLTSKDLRVARHFRLDFDGGEQRITPLTRIAAARYRPAAPDARPPLSAIERLHEWERNVDQMQTEAWDDFFMAAGETVSQFRAMREDESPPPAQKWETFKRTAAHASRSATRLPEPYNEQARALLRPFLDLEQANLEGCVTAANELQSFILKRQAGVQPDPPAGVL
jgi:hypothetical protein